MTPSNAAATKLRIALVEDDPQQSNLLASWLDKAGYPARCYRDGRQFLRSVAQESYDMLVLDLRLPDLDGIEVLDKYRSIAQDGPGVMVVSVRDAESDAVAALEHGADDFMRKPLRAKEFLARIRALGRRSAARLEDLEPFAIDIDARQVYLDGKSVRLTLREFEMAVFLFQRRDQLVSRNHILESVWGNDQLLLSRTVDTHISRLRKKLGLNGESGWRLISIYRRGYSLQRVS